MRSDLHSLEKHTRRDESGARKESTELWDSEKREGPGLSQRSELEPAAPGTDIMSSAYFCGIPSFAYLLLPIRVMSVEKILQGTFPRKAKGPFFFLI